jgi:hypothetical protein
LRAIAYVESRGNVGAIGSNSDGSVDLCAMQINSRHWPASVSPVRGLDYVLEIFAALNRIEMSQLALSKPIAAKP